MIRLEVVVMPGTKERVHLQIRADQITGVRISAATNLTDWFPYLEGVVGEGLPFRIEVPTGFGRQAFFRLQEREDLRSQLKPMVLIPGGTFLMGQEGPYASDLGLPVAGPVHEVTLSPFRMDAHEVTWAEWTAVMSWAVDPARGSARYQFRNAGAGAGPDHPVVMIDWFDAVKWANARSEMGGLSPVYFTDPARTNVYRTGTVEVANQAVDWLGPGYRLPTEAEWEYAARGGLSQRIYPWGDEHPGSTHANFRFDYDGTTAVGIFPPNGYGLFDMAGYVREWCWDLHKDDPSVSYTNHIVFAPYDPEPQTDPHGPDTGPRGMSRGGSWLDTYHYIQCGRRHNDERDRLTGFAGLRVVSRRRDLP